MFDFVILNVLSITCNPYDQVSASDFITIKLALDLGPKKTCS